MRPLALAFVLAVGVCSLAGCGRAGAKVQNGIDYYEHGAYQGALIKFHAMDAEEGSLRKKTRARYLVYRGLAHWHLKQTDEARRYLREAKQAFADGGDPKWVPSDVREELAQAEGELGIAETLPGKPGSPPALSSPPDGPSPPGTPPGPPDGTPAPSPDKAPGDASPSPASSPSSPTSSPPSPPGAVPGPALPANTTPPPEMM